MRSEELEQAVFERWGDACVVCGRRPEEWLETNLGERDRNKLSFHHVNGDGTDDRVENIIPAKAVTSIASTNLHTACGTANSC